MIDINQRDSRGATALFVAVMKRQFDVIKYLVENGSELNNTYSIWDDSMAGWNPKATILDYIDYEIRHINAKIQISKDDQIRLKEMEEIRKFLISHGAK